MSGPTPRSLSDLPAVTVLDTDPGTTDLLLVRQAGVDKKMTADKLPGAAGFGNVTGPLTAIDGDIPVFDGTTGELIKDSGVNIDSSQNLTGLASLVSDAALINQAFENDGTLTQNGAIFLNHDIKTANFTLDPTTPIIFIDTSGGAVTCTVPATMTEGMTVKFYDLKGTWQINNFTLAVSNATNIIEGQNTVVFNKKYANFELLASAADAGIGNQYWIIPILDSGALTSVTLTPDSGSALTGSSFPVIGQKAGTNTPTVSTNTASGNLLVEVRGTETQYIVDPSTTIGKRGTFTTIQAAVTAIVADSMASSTRTGTIILRGTTFTENVTIPANIRLIIRSSSGPLGASWSGQITNNAARLVLSGIELYNTGGNSITNPGLGVVSLVNCNVTNYSQAGGTVQVMNGYFADCTITGGSAMFYNCQFAFNAGTINLTNVAGAQFYNCYCSPGTGITLNGSGSTYLSNCSSLTLTGTANGVIYLTDCSIIAGINLPNATLVYSGITADFGSIIANFFIAANSRLVQQSLMGNVFSARRVSATTTISKNDMYIGVTGNASAVVLTIPTASMTANQMFQIADEAGTANTKNITLTPASGTINGASSFVMNAAYQQVSIVFDGTNYFVSSNSQGSGGGGGGGDVTGPGSSVNNNFATFNGTTGKIIKDSGLSAASFLQPSNNLSDVASASTARTNLGLAIGTNVQAYDATLQSLSSLGTTADRYAYTTGVDTWVEGTITAFARTILSGANAAAVRSTLGLGTAATSNTTDFLSTANNLSELVATKQTAFNNISPLTTKGDLLVRDATNSTRLPVGANGQMLTPDSSTATGLKWAAIPGAFAWQMQTTTPVTLVADTGYIMNNASLITATLPTTAAVGSIIRIAGYGAGGWRLNQNASQIVHTDDGDTTTGTGGYIVSTSRYNVIEMICVVANTEWVVLSTQGNLQFN